MSDLDWAIVYDGLRRERDAALEEQRRAVARLAEVSVETARLRAALATIALGNVRSPERFASLILDGAEVDAARAEDERRWRAEVGS